MDIFTTYGYFGLFLAAFLAATVLPLSSEAVLYFSIQQNGEWAIPVLIASLGNILGSVVNYWLGHKGSNLLLQKLLHMDARSIRKATRRFQKYGVYSLLFAWIPVVGDPLTVAAGLFKTRFFLFLLLVSIGKSSRYLLFGLLSS